MPRGRSKARGTTSADVRIGSLIRVQRLSKGLTQTELGNAIGIAFQQVNKYEKGVNRVPGARLEQIAKVLDMSPSDFFKGSSDRKRELESLVLVRNAAALRLLRAFNEIKSWSARNALVEIAEKMAAK